MSKLEELEQWLLERRGFRVAWFAKDPQRQQPPEEALANMPEALAEKLIDAINDLPVHPQGQAVVSEAIVSAISRWRSHPDTAANSIVVIADPVSSVSSIVADSLQTLGTKITAAVEDSDQPPLEVNLLDWVKRPNDAKTIQQQIKAKLGLSEGLSNGLPEGLPGDRETQPNSHALMVVPNLCWCFLRSADGLDGLDYLQDLLPCNRTRFWVLGSGTVGWDYLKSTIKFHAYCGKTITMPRLSGEDLQSWLSSIVEKFDIYFPETGLHKRFQSGNHLLEIDVDIDKPIETASAVSQEVVASVRSSIRSFVRSLKKRIRPEEYKQVDNSPQEIYFERLANISDGIAEVAVQLFIESLRYCQVKQDAENPEAKIVLKHVSDLEPDAGSDASPGTDSETSPDTEKIEADRDAEQEYQLVVTTPKLPQLPELSQNDLYLLYSLTLHGDMTVVALSKSLGDSPNVVNNQVQFLRNVGIVEQQGSALKLNPVHHPKLCRELSRNNFMIEAP